MRAEKYMVIPFREKGRDAGGLDCWGLVRWVLGQETGIWLPLFDGVDTESTEEIAYEIHSQSRRPEWRKIEIGSESIFDVAIMKSILPQGFLPVHIGIFVDRGRLLHTELLTGPVCQSIAKDEVRRRIVGIYRNCRISGS